MIENDYYGEQRTDIDPFVPTELNKTLDVGCATGIFSERLKRKYNVSETWGIEMHEPSAKEAMQRLDKVLAGTFDNVCEQLPKNYFDCIFFNDVLEHMSNPESCLIKVKENLAPNGKIIASLPNMRRIGVLIQLLVHKDWKYTDFGIMDRTHLRFFTKKSMIRLFEESGYKVDLIKGINPINNRLLSITNKLLFNNLEDTKYYQYIIKASVANIK